MVKRDALSVFDISSVTVVSTGTQQFLNVWPFLKEMVTLANSRLLNGSKTSAQMTSHRKENRHSTHRHLHQLNFKYHSLI